jgi:pyrimidine operon attenuation protein/uracil phosphoribosyltransferase
MSNSYLVSHVELEDTHIAGRVMLVGINCRGCVLSCDLHWQLQLMEKEHVDIICLKTM